MATAPTAEDRGRRFAAIDAFRGLAIVAMVVYHTAFDLSARRLVPFDATRDVGWVILARLTAGAFLMLVGWNLVLATRNGFKPQPFLRRLGIVVAAALLVSAATWWSDPRTFVFFGILHQIALASVLALPFLSMPIAVVLAGAAIVVALPLFYVSTVFDWPPLSWLGLSATPPLTVDYVPVFPWFGVVLAGVVLGRLFLAYSLDTPFARWRPSDRFSGALVWAGRWSLAIYLIHQPVLYGALWAANPWLTPSDTALQRSFTDQCAQACRLQGRADETCNAFCGCMFANLHGTDLMAAQSLDKLTEEQRKRWDGVLAACRPSDSGT